MDYIDTSVFLAAVFDEGQEYWDYLRVLGYKSHDKGVISEYVLGELLNHVLTDINDENPRLEVSAKKRAMEFLHDLISEKEKEGVLGITPFSVEVDCELINELRTVDRELSFDDALHLNMLISENCRRFITKDEGLLENQVLKNHLKKEYGVKVSKVS